MCNHQDYLYYVPKLKTSFNDNRAFFLYHLRYLSLFKALNLIKLYVIHFKPYKQQAIKLNKKHSGV